MVRTVYNTSKINVGNVPGSRMPATMMLKDPALRQYPLRLRGLDNDILKDNARRNIYEQLKE